MNRRKLIYFLSAFVLIIGCYALNLSYSLFTQNISSRSNVVDTSVPIINANLETTTFTILANSSEVVKLKIINSGTANIQYGVSIIELPEGINSYLVEKNGNDIVGNVEASKNKEILIYLENTTTTESTITFNLETKYETINFDKVAFINNSNIDCINKVKLLNESILARAKDTTIIDENKTVYDEDFDSSNITGISGENERKLITSEDDYGTSYVFRGAVKDNYVNFAGFTWRIVRINGDGSIRLILDGTLDKVCADYEKDSSGNCTKNAGTTSAFNSSYNDNALVGYMYGFTGGVTNKCLTKDTTTNKYTVDSSTTYITKETCEDAGGRWAETPYETTHVNIGSSIIKRNIDTFYVDYLLNDYNGYIADTLFCNDKTPSTIKSSIDTTNLGYGNEISYYKAYDRLFYNGTIVSSTNPANPTLKCANDAANIFSRFTVSEQNINAMKTNGDLTYAIALLSADELVLAGAFRKAKNESYYLNDTLSNNDYWWTISPSHVIGGDAYMFRSFNTSESLDTETLYSARGVRPVINLKANVLIESGDGTKEITYDKDDNQLTKGPYVIREISSVQPDHVGGSE